MILVDTSVWADHLRKPDPTMNKLLEHDAVLFHPFVVGEIAMGSFKGRESVLASMKKLRPAVVAKEDEVLRFVSDGRLYGSGIGYIDAHLVAAATLTAEALFWTRDKRLLAVAAKLGVAFEAVLWQPHT